jgi:predicted nucleic acid-binding protein
MYLVDTNIWLEVLLEQEKKVESYEFLETTDSQLLHITDFSLYSIGIILTRLKKLDAFDRFVGDIIIESSVNMVRLIPEDIKRIIEIEKEFDLDFDDSYQYVAAERFDLKVVSFDSDFDKTEKGRTAPEEILEAGHLTQNNSKK